MFVKGEEIQNGDMVTFTTHFEYTVTIGEEDPYVTFNKGFKGSLLGVFINGRYQSFTDINVTVTKKKNKDLPIQPGDVWLSKEGQYLMASRSPLSGTTILARIDGTNTFRGRPDYEQEVSKLVFRIERDVK